MIHYIFYFLLAAIVAIVVTPWVKRLAVVLGCIDIPNQPRKIHAKPMPLLGGFALFFTCLVVGGAYILASNPDMSTISARMYIGIILGSLVLIIGGALDDRYQLPARITWIFPGFASLIVVLFGVGSGITSLTNPLGGSVFLDYHPWGISIPGVVVWVWLMGMIFTTKILDGLDGLASGIGLIAGLTLFFLSLTDKVNQPVTASLAIIFTGCLLGYLVYAFNPASIFLGESGSTYIGFILGVLSVISGAKIATALLVMGIPILDLAWAIIRRLLSGKSPFHADRKHLHFRLLDIGFTQRQSVLILYALSAVFGFTAVFLQSKGKLIALGILFLVMVALVMALVVAYRRKYAVKN